MKLWRMLALMLAVLAFTRPAPAAKPDWGTEPYTYLTIDQDLRQVLKDFAAQLGVTLQLSPAVQGTVRGRLPPAAPEQFLEQLARVYGLLWYWDGYILWVYGLEEADSRVVQLQTASTQQLADTLAELDIWDERFPIRASLGSNILLVTGPSRYVDLVVETAEMLEANRNVAVEIRTFPLRYASADDRIFTVRDQQVTVPGVATILRRLLDTGEVELASGTQRTWVGTVTRFLGAGGIAFSGPQGAIHPPAGDGIGPGASLPKEDDTEVRVQADPRLNAVIIRDLADRMPLYAQLIESLDRKQPLIELEVVIADISSDRLLDLGVDWQASVDGNGDSASVGVGDPAGLALSQGLTFTTAISVDPLSVLARIRALESRGEARIVSRPAVLTFDNVEALLDQSESFFVRLEGENTVDLAEITVGLLVKVTPRLIDEGGTRPKVQMTIDIEDGTSLPQRQVDQLPTVQRATLSTQGLVTERQALVIGGFYRERQLDTLEKVPFLGDIPVLGWALFQRRGQEQSSITRLFMIRPLVVTEQEERQVVSGSLTRDGPPARLFRPEAELGLTPEGAMRLDEIRFGRLLGGRVLGRAEAALCLARASLAEDCHAGPVPPLDADPFGLPVAAGGPAAFAPLPPLY